MKVYEPLDGDSDTSTTDGLTYVDSDQDQGQDKDGDKEQPQPRSYRPAFRWVGLTLVHGFRLVGWLLAGAVIVLTLLNTSPVLGVLVLGVCLFVAGLVARLGFHVYSRLRAL